MEKLNASNEMNKIWHARDIDSTKWFLKGINEQKGWTDVHIPNPGSAEFLNLPEPLKRILALDKPDLIVSVAPNGVDIPILSIEITTTTPQSQHAKQRIARLIAAAEEGIPSIYIIPEKKCSGGSMYGLGNDLFTCLEKISKINNIPCSLFAFPDNNGVLVHDKRHPGQPCLKEQSTKNFFSYVKEILSYYRKNNSFVNINKKSEIVSKDLKKINQIAKKSPVKIENFLTLELIETSNLASYLKENTELSKQWIQKTIEAFPSRICTRKKTLIFKPQGRMLEHAGDPYVGMYSFFDYMFCRNGKHIEDRHTNLVYMPLKEHSRSIYTDFGGKGFKKYWEKQCPFSKEKISFKDQFSIAHALQYGCVFTKAKPLRIYSYVSDIIVFKDSILVF